MSIEVSENRNKELIIIPSLVSSGFVLGYVIILLKWIVLKPRDHSNVEKFSTLVLFLFKHTTVPPQLFQYFFVVAYLFIIYFKICWDAVANKKLFCLQQCLTYRLNRNLTSNKRRFYKYLFIYLLQYN